MYMLFKGFKTDIYTRHLTSLGIIDQQKTELNALKTGMQDKEREIEKLGLRSVYHKFL